MANDNSKLNIKWLSHLQDKEEREQMEISVRGSIVTLERLRTILQEMLQQAEVVKTSDYEMNSWAYYQADKAGQQRVLKDLLKLTDHIKD